MSKPKHPIQPIIKDEHGVLRFKTNAIVRHLLDHGGISLNDIAVMAHAGKFTKDDQWQFAQLIGYSLSGIGDLDYHDKKALAELDEKYFPKPKRSKQ